VTFKLRSRLLGAHVHATVFIGADADHLQSSGELVMGIEQWCVLNMMLSAGRYVASRGGLDLELLRDDAPALNDILHMHVIAAQAKLQKDERCPSPSPASDDASAPKKNTPS
jgi:hypothetical protein